MMFAIGFIVGGMFTVAVGGLWIVMKEEWEDRRINRMIEGVENDDGC